MSIVSSLLSGGSQQGPISLYQQMPIEGIQIPNSREEGIGEEEEEEET